MKKYIKVYKIIRKKDYHTTCSICNRKLKRALITEEGTMGYRCYLTQIGVPTRKKTVSLKDLPDNAFEGIAENIIKKIERIDPKKIANLTIPDVELKYPILYQSNIHFRYFPKNQYTKNPRWKNRTLITQLWRLKKELGIPQDIMKEVLDTNTMNKWIHKQMKMANKNSQGLSKKEFLKIRKKNF